MRIQPMYCSNESFTLFGRARGSLYAYIDYSKNIEVTIDIFNRGLCLPSDIKQTFGHVETDTEVVKRCFSD